MTLAALLLTAISTNAMAEWTWFAASSDEVSEFYVDYATIRKTGSKAKMWVLLDLKSAAEYQGIKFLSTKTQKQFDCLNEMTKTLYETEFSENMGGGAVVLTFNSGNWMPISPDSINNALWKIACGKK